jgi:PhnB protein
MQVNPYLSFKGDCEEAFKLYEQCFGGQLGEIFRYGGSPMEQAVPADWNKKVMHCTLTVGDQILMGSDVFGGRYEEPKGFSMSIQPKTAAEADAIFDALAKDGHILMPLEKTFWSERFGMLVDRYGIPWMINCETAGE